MYSAHQLFSLMVLATIFLSSACSSSDDTRLCGSDSAILAGSDICLVFEDEGQLESIHNNITTIVKATIAGIQSVMPIDNLRIRIDTELSRVIPEIGLGGYNPNEEEVIISIDPNFAELEQAIQSELAPVLAHETHHAKRRRSAGYGSTLLQAIVSEGLADHFAIEVTGSDPPIWSVALTEPELQDWIETASNTWNDSPYDHSKWFFGTSPDVPRWTGYSIGFKLVNDFLSANPASKPSDLFNEPADSFIP